MLNSSIIELILKQCFKLNKLKISKLVVKINMLILFSFNCVKSEFILVIFNLF